MSLRTSLATQYPSCFAVYAFVFPTGHFYIGSTNNLAKRLRDHRGYLEAGTHQNFKMQRLYEGWDELRIDFECYEDRDEAYVEEQRLLDRHHGDEYCLNISTDARSLWGNGRGRPTEVSDRIAASQKGRIVTDEFREACRKRMTGNVMSDMTRQRISRALSGRTLSDEHKQRVGDANRGKLLGHKHTDEQKAKKKATWDSRGGFKHRDESRRLIADANKKKVSAAGVIYDSIAEAADALGVNRRTITDRVKNNSDRFRDYFFVGE